jgi:hypothetical protein
VRSPNWLDIKAAYAQGLLAPPFVTAYFTLPRPTYELYDLQADPGELVNLAGKKSWDAYRELKRALTEKMVRDYDYLPTPSK